MPTTTIGITVTIEDQGERAFHYFNVTLPAEHTCGVNLDVIAYDLAFEARKELHEKLAKRLAETTSETPAE